MSDYNIRVESETMDKSNLESLRQQVRHWKNEGYSLMAIFHFIEEKHPGIFGTIEDNTYVITVK